MQKVKQNCFPHLSFDVFCDDASSLHENEDLMNISLDT